MPGFHFLAQGAALLRGFKAFLFLCVGGHQRRYVGRFAVVIDSHGWTVTLVQVAGLLARRILCHARPGQVLTRGQRYGGVRFGSRVDVYLPIDAMPRVAPGDRVSATTTILATLPTTA